MIWLLIGLMCFFGAYRSAETMCEAAKKDEREWVLVFGGLLGINSVSFVFSCMQLAKYMGAS